MSAVTHYKVGDMLPEYTATLTQGSGRDRQPINLTGVTVKFQLRDRDTMTIVVDAAATIESPATDGKVRYAWGTSDLSNEGSYDAFWELTFSGDRKMTVPSEGADLIVVERA